MPLGGKESCKLREFLKRHLLLLLTISGILVGFALGFGIRETSPSSSVLLWLGFPGEIFLRLLKMMIIPLIVSSVISGTASLDPKSNGKISGISITYITATNFTCCLLGLLLAVTIRPGERAGSVEVIGRNQSSIMTTEDIFADLIRNIFPDNPMTATFRQARTDYTEETVTVQVNTSQGLVNQTVTKRTRYLGSTDGANILGLIFCSMVFGIGSSFAKEKGRAFIDFFTSCSEVVLMVLRAFLWYAPVGICSLIAGSIASVTDLEIIFARLGFLVLTVSVGVVIHQLIMVPLIHFVFTRTNPFPLMLRLHRAWLIAFSSSSTAVAIPEMLEACDRSKMDRRISSFVIPFSVTLSANGSAIFIVSAALFLAQVSGVDLNAGQLVTITVLTGVSCMALPSVPSSSLVALVIIMTSLGLPTYHFGLLFAVEWFLDRIRTTSSVLAHTFCAALTCHFCRDLSDKSRDTKKRGQNEYSSKPSSVDPGEIELIDGKVQSEHQHI